MGASISPAGPTGVGGAFSASPPTPKQGMAGCDAPMVSAPPKTSAGGPVTVGAPPAAVAAPPAPAPAPASDAIAGAAGGPTTGGGPTDAVNGAAGLPGLAGILQQLTDLLTKLTALISQMKGTSGGGPVQQSSMPGCDMPGMTGTATQGGGGTTVGASTTTGGASAAMPGMTMAATTPAATAIAGGGAAAAPAAAATAPMTAEQLHLTAQTGGFPSSGTTTNPTDGKAVPNLDINAMFSNMKNIAVDPNATSLF